MRKAFLAYGFVVLLFSACRKENAFDCVKSNGDETSEIRRPGDFSVIKVYGKIDINISKGQEYLVTVRAGENIIKNIETRVINGELIIQNENKCNFVRGYKRRIVVDVTLPYIERVNNEGVGTVNFTGDFTQDTIKVRAENSGDIHLNGNFKQVSTSSHGNGDIYVSGTCNRLFVYSFGTNYTHCENLKVHNYIFVETLSIGDCYLNAPDSGILECNIWKSGNVYYKGSPAVINDFSNGTGSGKLKQQ